jgi:hypothetical protein
MTKSNRATALRCRHLTVLAAHARLRAQGAAHGGSAESLRRCLSAGKLGDDLFHGDAAAEKRMGTTLSRTGMACAMCHPFASDTHPHEFPKFQEQINAFATLRDMINWCIEKPNEGEKLAADSEAMKALEAYIYYSNRNSKLDPGRH